MEILGGCRLVAKHLSRSPAEAGATRMSQVSSHCSDLAELVGGQPRVAVAVPAKADSTADADSMSGTDQVGSPADARRLCSAVCRQHFADAAVRKEEFSPRHASNVPAAMSRGRQKDSAQCRRSLCDLLHLYK